ncbi:hypothetical protein CRE_15001 [Caenorhabditis remanei]|uniref:Uncharacterized protein n=1 Tax=Caenorhabditis remanei TaxID=31234 RepID=E3NH92_CAERE|nr:hypothetical protein CRE_15001 [Caenorhabditis remanei]
MSSAARPYWPPKTKNFKGFRMSRDARKLCPNRQAEELNRYGEEVFSGLSNDINGNGRRNNTAKTTIVWRRGTTSSSLSNQHY